MVKCPFSVKACITTSIICLFLIRGLQLYLSMHKSDYKIERNGLINKQPFEGDTSAMYLHLSNFFDNKDRMENFELIQMMNETNPNQINDDAMLVVSASLSSVQNTYAHLLQKIQKSNPSNSSLPFYLLRKAKNLLIQNSKSIKQEVDQIVKVLEYFTESLMIKKLTILSFQEGSLLCLRALSLVKYDVFSIIDKFILINPFNPMIVILHGNAASFLKQTKQKILSDAIRTQLVNDTRIIIIHTINNNPGDEKINWLFKNSIGQKVTFSNSLVIQSKLMWNVYSYLKPEEYFRYQPFIDIISRFFHEDRQNGPLSIKEINYLFLYRQNLSKKQLSIEKRNKLLTKCVDFYMQNYSQEGVSFHVQCIRILRKQDFYFNQNTTIIIRSFHRFQVLGQNFEKILPYETKEKQTVYLLQNVMQYRRIFVFNTKRHTIQINIQPIIRPQIVKINWVNNAHSKQNLYPKYKIIYSVNSQPVSLCPGNTILYPSHLVPMLYQTYYHVSSQFSFEQQTDCYLGVDSYMALLRNLLKNWSFGFNLVIFSLFCFHVIKKSTFTRFYYQLIVNYFLTFIHTGQSLISQNLIILSIVVVLEQILKLATFMSDMIYMSKKLAIKAMWLPLVFQILRYLKTNIFSPWKVLGLIFFVGTRKNNIAILFIQFAFIIEYVIRDLSNPQGLFLCCSWLALSSIQENPQTKNSAENSDIITITTGKRLKSLKQTILTLRKQIVDTIALCIMAMCLSQDGIVIHFIIDFYIITFVIFAVHQQFHDLA